MKKPTLFQNGQALVLIAVAFMSLIGIVALAIDGGNAYADRRQGQNAADTSSLAAALAYAKNTALTNSSLFSIALGSTTTNGFNNVQPRSTVILSTSNATTECDPYVIGKFFQVDITSIVPTYFGKAIGVTDITNHIFARSLSCPPHPAPAGLGNAITALNPTACPGTKVTGSTHVIVTSTTNQGLFVNSSCNEGINSSQVALSGGGNGTVTTPSVRVVGGVYGQDIFAPTVVQTGSTPLETSTNWPIFTSADCGSTVTELTSASPYYLSGYSTLTPGTFPGSNSAWSNKKFPPNTNTRLLPGIYCLDKTFEIQANMTLVSLTAPTKTGPDGVQMNGVTFVSRQGDVIFRGGNGVNIKAPTAGSLKGLLVFVNQANTAGAVTVNGNANLVIVGSIIAPWDIVDLKGGGDISAPLQTQVIADTLNFSGNGTLQLSFDDTTQYHVSVPGAIELYK